MTRPAVDDGKNRSVVTEHQHHQYFPPPPPPPPFQGVSNPNYVPPPQQQPPATGFQQPAQNNVSIYNVNGGRAETEHYPLPCGIGIGWILFILGFLLGAIPWYIGFFLLLCSKDRRERPGFIACTVGAVIVTIFIIIGVISGSMN